MKKITINRCDAGEIFRYADKKYGISWNTCNDLFYHSVINYQKLNHIYLYDCVGNIEDDVKDCIVNFDRGLHFDEVLGLIRKFPVEFVLSQETYVRANIILINFMLDNDVNEMEVTG